MYAIRSYYDGDVLVWLTSVWKNFIKRNRVYQNYIKLADPRITSYNVCYTKLLRYYVDVFVFTAVLPFY